MEFEDYFKNDELMNTVRETVKLVFPEAQERISYGMPAWFKDCLLYTSSMPLVLLSSTWGTTWLKVESLGFH